MAKIKPIPIIIFGIVIVAALLVAFMSFKKLQNKMKAPVTKNLDTQLIAVADSDLAPGTTLTNAKGIAPAKGMIKFVPFLKKSLPSGCFSDPSTLEGRIIIFPVNADEPILESRLAPITIKTGGIAAVVSSKKRAMAVKVNPVTGISGFIHPGNRVDILVTVRLKGKEITTKTGGTDSSREEKESVEWSEAKTVLENILVLATGVELMSEKQEKPTPVEVVTLEVTPEEAEKLALASYEGSIHLALRNVIDSDDVFTKGAIWPALITSYGVAGKTSGIKEGIPQINTVELIKGTMVTILKFGMGGETP